MRSSKAARRGLGALCKLPHDQAVDLQAEIRSVKTAGGHHRIPQSEIDRLSIPDQGEDGALSGTLVKRQVSGRNQLVGRIETVRISGLMAEVKVSIGDQQITSIITASSAREMNLKPGQTAAALIKAT